ncbi:MAG: lipoprotein-releasing ABC transporter permease subunit [Arenicellales bacterium WSBS_2016_MAG_OTU3]
MIRWLELTIGLRYTRAKRRNHFISFISAISVLGIVIGVWALITVISIMNGFERELRERILSVASHVTVSARGGLENWQQLSQSLENNAEIQANAPYILGQGMLSSRGEVAGAILRGVLPERESGVSTVLEKITTGATDDLKAGEFGIVIGKDMAWKLGLNVGDKVTVVAPKGQITPAGMLPRLKRFTVVAIFNLGMYEYDSALALMHIDDADKLFRNKGKVTGIRLKLDDVYQAPLLRRNLKNTLGAGFAISDWTLEHANFFRALKIEKRVTFIVLFLIVAVAAFNIVSTLVMVVTDKQSDIAILRTQGMSPASVMKIFMIQGTMIGVVGTIAGGVLGVITALNVSTIIPWIEGVIGAQLFPADIYVITDFPADLRWPDVYTILSFSFLISLLSTIYPAWRASCIEPADALRYE